MTNLQTLKTAPQKAISQKPAVRWMQVPVVDGDVIVRRNGTWQLLEDEVGTAEAARLIGCSIRYVQTMCDEGRLAEGWDWRKIPGSGIKRQYRIRRAAAMALRLSRDTEASEPQSRGRLHF